jgi:hypothetical protein
MPAKARPAPAAFERKVVVRNAPPPNERPFITREQQLRQNPGHVPEPRAVESAPSRDTTARQNVRVIPEQHGAVDARAAGSRRENRGDRADKLPKQDSGKNKNDERRKPDGSDANQNGR